MGRGLIAGRESPGGLRIGWSRHPFGAHGVHDVPPFYDGVLDRLEALAGIT
jgi:hypothetical protein